MIPATPTIRSVRSEKTKEEMMRLSLVDTQSGAHVSGESEFITYAAKITELQKVQSKYDL